MDVLVSCVPIKLRLAQEDDPMLRAGAGPALERYREVKAKLVTLDRLKRKRRPHNAGGEERVWAGMLFDSERY